MDCSMLNVAYVLVSLPNEDKEGRISYIVRLVINGFNSIGGELLDNMMTPEQLKEFKESMTPEQLKAFEDFSNDPLLYAYKKYNADLEENITRAKAQAWISLTKEPIDFQAFGYWAQMCLQMIQVSKNPERNPFQAVIDLATRRESSE